MRRSGRALRIRFTIYAICNLLARWPVRLYAAHMKRAISALILSLIVATFAKATVAKARQPAKRHIDEARFSSMARSSWE